MFKLFFVKNTISRHYVILNTASIYMNIHCLIYTDPVLVKFAYGRVYTFLLTTCGNFFVVGDSFIFYLFLSYFGFISFVNTDPVRSTNVNFKAITLYMAVYLY